MTCPCEPKITRPKGCKGNTPPVLEIEAKDCPVLFHTVNIPASVGTVATMPPTPGAYRNARVTYEADQESYLYDSDGIPQLLSNGGSSAVLSVNGQTGAVVLSAGDVGAATTAELSNKQDVLTAGANINITDNTISATDTTYSNFVGTDGVDAGVQGLVPAPATTDAGKFLKADGTWDTVGGGIDPNTTFWGQSVVNGAVDGAITNTKSPSTFDIQYKPTGSTGGASISFNSAGQTTFYSLRKSWGTWGAEFVAYMDTTGFGVKPIISQYASNPIMPTDAKHYTCKAYVDQVGNTLSPAAPTSATVGVLGQLYTDTTNMHTYQCTAIDTTDPANPSYTWTQRW